MAKSKEKVNIESMGTDCLGNETFAPVEEGRLCSITGCIYETRQEAAVALRIYQGNYSGLDGWAVGARAQWPGPKGF